MVMQKGTQVVHSVALSEVVVWIILWHVCYWLAYLALPYVSAIKISPEDANGEKGYWCAMIVSTMHACVSTALSAYVILTEPALLDDDAFLEASPTSLLACKIFLGYMLHDTIVSLYFGRSWPGWKETLAHHVMVGTAWAQLTLGGWAQGLTMVAQVMETSTVFVNMRWFFDKLGMKTTRAYLVNAVFLLVTFFLFRILLYTYAFVVLYKQRAGLTDERVGRFGAVVFLSCFVAGYLLMWLWFTKIVHGGMKYLNAANAETDPIARQSSSPGSESGTTKTM